MGCMLRCCSTVLAWLLMIGAPCALGAPFPLKRDLKFDETSRYALLVFEAAPQTQVINWSISVMAFDPDLRKWTYGPRKGWAQFDPIGLLAPGERSFHAALVEPGGVYAVASISSQRWWHACFNAGTRAFRLEAGKVNYIGLIDPVPGLVAMATLPRKSKGGQQHISFDTVQLTHTPPALQQEWSDSLARFIAERFPQVLAPVVTPDPVETTFEPARSLIAGKICQRY